MKTPPAQRGIGRMLASAVLALSLAACGGGGGGGGGAAPPNGPSPPSAPPSTSSPLGPLAFTSTTGRVAAYLALSASVTVLDWSDAFLEVTASYASAAPRRIALDCRQSGRRSADLVDHDGNQRVSSGDDIVMELFDCDQYVGEVTLRVSEVQAGPSGVTLLRGTIRYAIEIDARNGLLLSQHEGAHAIEFTHSAGESTWNIADGAFTMLGWHAFPQGPAPVTEALEQQAETFTDFVLSRHVDQNGVYTVELSGRVQSPFFGGRFDFATPVPFAGDHGNYPVLGELRLGHELDEIRLEPSADPWEMVTLAYHCCVDADGDGADDPPTPELWVSLGADPLFGVLSANILSTPDGNRQPFFTHFAMSPDVVYTDDDIAVAVAAQDPDGDPIEIAYQWRRNGWVVQGQTGPTFPAAEQRRGDVIVASVRVSDGQLASVQHAHTIVQDSGLRISAPSSLTAMPGEVVAFQAVVEDPDGDPFVAPQLVLDYGPAGMTVDPDTGAVEWRADLPLFERDTELNWRLSTTDPNIAPIAGVFTVQDPARAYPLMRTRLQAPKSRAALAVGDFDADGKSTMLVLGFRSLYELEWNGTDYVQTWALPFGFVDHRGVGETLHTMAVGDADHDGLFEIYFALSTRVVKLAGTHRRVALDVTPQSASLASVYCTSDMAFADVDLDGAGEIVCSSENRIAVLSAATLEVERISVLGEYGQALAIGNVDTDPALEIVTSGGYVFDGATFANEWVFGDGGDMDVGIGNIDGTGHAEIVVTDFLDRKIRAYDAVGKQMLFEVDDPAPGELFVGNVIGDGAAEIVVGRVSDTLTIYAYDAATQGLDVVDSITLPSPNVSSIVFGDVDADGESELVLGTGVGTGLGQYLLVARTSPGLALEWSNEPDASSSGPFLGAQPAQLAADRRELVYGSAMTLFGLDPATGAVVRSASDPGVMLALADYDADGVDEALTARDNEYRLYDFAIGTAEVLITATYEEVAAGAAGNVIGDEKPELALLTRPWPAKLRLLDALTQTLAAELSFPFAEGRDVAFADLDGDGASEIVVATSNALHVVKVTEVGSLVPAGQSFEGQVVDMAIGDTTGDGAPEIYVLTDFPKPRRVHRLNSSLELEAIFELDEPAESVHIERLGFARSNIAVCNEVDGASFLTVLDATTGAFISRSPVLNGCAEPNSLSYFKDASGAWRIAMGTANGMLVTR